MKIGFVTSNEALARDREMPHLLAAAAARGLEAEAVCWESGDACEELDLLVIRSTWNYITRLEEFLAWTRLFRSGGGSARRPVLINPEGMIRWNCHKRYLAELAHHGIPVVESSLVTTRAGFLEHAQQHERAVAKPAVGGGAIGCSRFQSADLTTAVRAFDAAADIWPEVVVQPYLESIETSGESSLVIIDGEIVKSVRKSPAEADWRVQREWGGAVDEAGYSSAQREVAESCFSFIRKRCGASPLFMRVDLMADLDGRPLVSEVELIEPVLYMDLYPEVADRLVAALASYSASDSTQ